MCTLLLLDQKMQTNLQRQADDRSVVVGEAGGGCDEKGKRGREELQKGTGNF